MYRTKVEVVDAVTAAELIGTTSMNGADIGNSFPLDPIATYHSKGLYTLNDIYKVIYKYIKYFSIFLQYIHI